MKEVFWNYKDDDKTFSLVSWMAGVLPAGVYRGFTPHAGTGWDIELRHTTSADNGYNDYDIDKNLTANVGIWISPQGTVIKKPTPAVATLAAAHATLDRIDIVVGQHNYIATVGGAPPTYYVVTGTPASTPVMPAVTFPATDTILAIIYIKGGTATLADAGNVLTRARIPSLGNSLIPVLDLLDKGVSSSAYNGRDTITVEPFYDDFDVTGFLGTITAENSLNIDSNKLYIVKAGLARKYVNDDGNQIYMPRAGFGVYKGRIFSIPAFSSTSIVMPPGKKLVYDPAGNYRTGITAVPNGDTVTSPKVVIPLTDIRFFNSAQFFNDWTTVTMKGTVTVYEVVRVKRVGQVVHCWGRVTVPPTLIDGDSGYGAFSNALPDFVRAELVQSAIPIQPLRLQGSGDLPYGTIASNKIWWNPQTNELGTAYLEAGTSSDPIGLDLRGKYFILPECYTF